MITQEDIDDIQFNLGLLKLVRNGKYEIGVGIPKESKFRKILARFIRIKNMERWLYLAIFITAIVGIMVPFYGKLPMLFLIACLLILEAGLLCMVYDQKPALDDAENNKRIKHQYKEAEKHARELMKRYLKIAYNEDTAHNIEEPFAKQDTLTLIGDYLKNAQENIGYYGEYRDENEAFYLYVFIITLLLVGDTQAVNGLIDNSGNCATKAQALKILDKMQLDHKDPKYKKSYGIYLLSMHHLFETGRKLVKPYLEADKKRIAASGNSEMFSYLPKEMKDALARYVVDEMVDDK